MFYYSLPILFNTIRTITPIELCVVALALLMLLSISAPAPENTPTRAPDDNYLAVGWLGKMKLYWVFWPFFLLLNLSLVAIDTLAKTANLSVSSWDDIHFVLLLMAIWWCTSVWRCSINTSNRFWAGFARFATLAVFAEYILKLWIRIDYPRVFFDCEDILLDYLSCF